MPLRRLLCVLVFALSGCEAPQGDPEPAGGGDDAAGGAESQGGSNVDGPAAGGARSQGGEAAGGASAGGAGGAGGSAPSCTVLGQSGEHELLIDVGGEQRRVLVHAPPQSTDEVRPLVVALHGFTASPEDMRDMTHLSELADQRGLVVAYPEGKSGSWNGGVCCGVSEWAGEDDVGFIAAVIAELGATQCVDAARVHVTGFSNGGFLTHRIGCELADTVASIAVVAGQEGVQVCDPSRPIAVLQIHGSADPVVPYGGNPILGYPSTESTVDGWAERDGCGASTSISYDEHDTLCETRSGCTQGTAVELCTVSGGMHDWFGGGTAWSEGTPPDDFVATLKVLEFFEAHPLL